MFYDNDSYLEPFKRELVARYRSAILRREEIAGYGKPLKNALNNHLYYGLHLENGVWAFREWAPNAQAIYVTGDFNGWRRDEAWRMKSLGGGNWELLVPEEALQPGNLYKWIVEWRDSNGAICSAERLPAYATRTVQNPETKLFAAEVQEPKSYRWRHRLKRRVEHPLIYEAHIGMSSEEETVANFTWFRKNILPHIAELGYNTLQIMALQEHPYYGSFGYQVSNFFALSSRFGTPAEFKALVDEAHRLGIAVIMDIVHSHAARNEAEGISNLDGSGRLYFHTGKRGDHQAWGTKCFNYGLDETLYFLLSNCKFWMEEYHLDGFRFDGVTSMLYLDHGLGRAFTSYKDYFSENTDIDAITYLTLANMLIHEINPNAITIAEDMSGMPGLAAPVEEGGVGFNFRMSMGIPDHWIKWIKERPDERWDMGEIWYTLTNKRADEQTISYAECHDQALVGDKTIIFRLMDAKMYTSMNCASQDPVVERGIALHKMIRLVTLATSGGGYLTFMGNEFGHPEWIDFPREGNNWSYFYARRQWSLSTNPFLRYKGLMEFDKAMISLFDKSNYLAEPPISIFNDIEKQIMVFRRGDALFLFNFSPVNSYTDYTVNVSGWQKRGARSLQEPAFEIVLDSDWKEFGGFERNSRGLLHRATMNANGFSLSLYLPARTAFIMAVK